MSAQNQTENQTQPKPGLLDPKANLKALVWLVLLLVVCIGGFWLYMRSKVGEKGANQAVSAVLHRPIELKNSIENVPASAYAAFPLTLPYTGTLTVDAKVVKGNELEVYVIEQSQLANVKAKKQFTQLQDFKGTKTKNYRRSARLNDGTYYLVFVDSSLGILSASSSDVQIAANLQP